MIEELTLLERLLRDGALSFTALALFAGLVFMREIGAFLHRRYALVREQGLSEEGYILSAALGLLALLYAFTFSLALDRFETRRALVVTEANALGTAWLRTSSLSEPERARTLMRAYAAERARFGHLRGAAARAAEARADAIAPELWAAVQTGLGADRATPLAPFVLDPLNTAFDTASARRAELSARLPGAVLGTLLLFATASAMVIGYSVSSHRHRPVSFMLFGLIALAFALILDLDQPRTGTILVPQAAMDEAVAAMVPPPAGQVQQGRDNFASPARPVE